MNNYTTDRNNQYTVICGFCALLGSFAIYTNSPGALGISAAILAAVMIHSRRV